jgi:hypothetical protein
MVLALQSMVHITPSQLGFDDFATQVVGWQHSPYTQSASVEHERSNSAAGFASSTGFPMAGIGPGVSTGKTSASGSASVGVSAPCPFAADPQPSTMEVMNSTVSTLDNFLKFIDHLLFLTVRT